MNEIDINNRFDYHPPKNEEVAQKHENVRRALKIVAHDILDLTPPGREQSLAITHLEEAMMWANASIARNE